MSLTMDVMRSPSTSRTNLVTNPSFESATTGWTRTGTIPSISLDSNYFVFGAKSVKGVASGNGLGTIVLSANIAVNTDATYTVSAYVRCSAARDFSIGVRWYDGSSVFINRESTTPQTLVADTWTRLSLTLPVLYGASNARVFIEADLLTSDSVYLDGVLMEQSDELDDYFDGTYAPTYTAPVYDLVNAWTGTANASTSTLYYLTRVKIDRIFALSFNGGRQTIIDTTAAGLCDFQIMNSDYSPTVLEKIEVYYGTHLLWLGYVADAVTDHSIPDDCDILHVSAESYLAKAGTREIGILSGTARPVLTLLDEVCTQVELVAKTTPTSIFTASHNTYEGNLLSFIQRLQMSFAAHLKENGEFIRLITREWGPFPQRGSGFTDSTTPTSSELRYDVLKFARLTDLSYDGVNVSRDTGGDIWVGCNGPTLNISTYVDDADAASALANYLLDIFDQRADDPIELSFIVNDDTSDIWAQMMDYAELGDGTGAGGLVFQKQTINFRGREHQCIVEGFSFSGSPESARIILYFGPEASFPALLLDETETPLGYGKLS